MAFPLAERLKALDLLGQRLREEDDYLLAVMKRTTFNNGWFTIENQQMALEAIIEQMLSANKLETWLGEYQLGEPEPKIVGLVLAGNIPLVGFHDVLSVFVAGHYSQIKLSEKDLYLLPYLIRLLGEIDERSKAYFNFTEKLQNFDAVIATGSNNTARYFQAYFGKYPNIIRSNRHAVAVLTGEETREDLLALGQDIFRYYGLGCRNVAKLYIPKGYDFKPLLEALHEHKEIVLNSKYKNNFDYHYALYILNKVEYQANGCIILTENEQIQSPIANLYYSYYEDNQALLTNLEEKASEIQLVTGSADWLPASRIPFGKAQQPELWDYADGVDTIKFLREL